MDTSLSNAKRRKVIDIPEQTFRTLSVRAAASGTNLKAFIEKMLVDYADSADDSHLYAYVRNVPKEKICLTKKKRNPLRIG